MKESDDTMERFILGLDKCRQEMKAKEGLDYAQKQGVALGGIVKSNPAGGLIIYIFGHVVHVWQPYQDIDRIYYEY